MADHNQDDGAAKPPVPTRIPGTAVDLHNAGSLRVGSLLDQSLANLTEEQRTTLVGKAAEEALRLEVKARELNMDAVAGKKAIEDHIDAFNMLDKDGRLTRNTVTTDVKTGAGTTKITSSSGVGSPCFVASAAYGDVDHPNVAYLRHFRSTVLRFTPAGRRFIAWYWVVGPKAARFVDRSRFLRSAARTSIAVVVRILRLRWS